MKHVTEFPNEVTEIPDMAITMPDGCRLSARVWMPKGAEEKPVPVILEHLPYRKRDGTIERDEFSLPWFAGHGYVCIRTDMRGNGESEGLMHDEYTTKELQDACDVIAWAADQPWCNGNVGMMGISWGGFNGLQVAALHPPALKAVITICSTVDRYADDIHYKGGCLLLENFGWSSNMLSYSSRPPDPELVGDKWLDMWRHRLENMPFNLLEWLTHQHRDAYWKHGSICEDYSAIQAAVLSIGGWHDGYRNTISHLVENLDAPVKGIVGPWIHKYPHYAGPKPAIGFLQEAKRWWDHWLKNEDTGVEDDPAYRAYLMESLKPERWFDERPGHWIADETWPSTAISNEIMHLSENNLLDSALTEINETVASPQHCGAQAGEYFPFAFSDELPDEQSPDDAHSICFDSIALSDDLDIVGAPSIALTLSSDQPTAIIAVRLCDLRPDGTSALITHGVLNLTHHTSHETPQALTPSTPVSIKLALDQIAYRIPKGHKLRVAISNTYWPVVWPSATTTTLKLKAGTLNLPVRETSTGPEWTFEEPQAAPAWQREVLREGSYERRVSTDPATGNSITEVACNFGEKRDLDHGLISGSWVREKFSIHPDDPLSAKTTSNWEQTGGREGAMWRTLASAEMHADATHFHYTAELETFLNEEPFHARRWSQKIKRDLV